jgi:hypothetical protein
MLFTQCNQWCWKQHFCMNFPPIFTFLLCPYTSHTHNTKWLTSNKISSLINQVLWKFLCLVCFFISVAKKYQSIYHETCCWIRDDSTDYQRSCTEERERERERERECVRVCTLKHTLPTSCYPFTFWMLQVKIYGLWLAVWLRFMIFLLP